MCRAGPVGGWTCRCWLTGGPKCSLVCRLYIYIYIAEPHILNTFIRSKIWTCAVSSANFGTRWWPINNFFAVIRVKFIYLTTYVDWRMVPWNKNLTRLIREGNLMGVFEHVGYAHIYGHSKILDSQHLLIFFPEKTMDFPHLLVMFTLGWWGKWRVMSSCEDFSWGLKWRQHGEATSAPEWCFKQPIYKLSICCNIYIYI